MDNIYLDAHVATPKELYDKSYLSAYEANKRAIREAVGDESEREVYFCASSAEAINSVLFSYYFQRARQTGLTHLMTPRTESAPVLLTLERLEEWGCSGKLLPLNAQGQLTKESLLKATNPRTGLLSLSWAQPLTGVIQPLAELAEVCHEKQIALHVDGSFVLGKLYFNLSDLPIDYFTFDGSSVNAPQGTAALLVRKEVEHVPLIVGGERTPLVPFTALAQAVLETSRSCDQMCLEIARLRDKLERGIKSVITESIIFFENVERLPSCSSMAFPGVHAEALLFLLQRHGVYASIGGGVQQRLSDVLLASGIQLHLAEAAISFSLSRETTEEQIDATIEIIAACVHHLKRSSLQVPL